MTAKPKKHAPNCHPDRVPGAYQRVLAGVRVINVGIAGFAQSLRAQGVPLVHVQWTPPGVDDRETLDLLEQLL